MGKMKFLEHLPAISSSHNCDFLAESQIENLSAKYRGIPLNIMNSDKGFHLRSRDCARGIDVITNLLCRGYSMDTEPCTDLFPCGKLYKL